MKMSLTFIHCAVVIHQELSLRNGHHE